jgi:YggT family protein
MVATATFSQKARLVCGSAPRPCRCVPRTRQSIRALPEVASVCLDGSQAGLLAGILKPVVAVTEFFFIMRIIMSWDPAYNTGDKLPWSIFYTPTEPVLAPTRKVIQPIGGVDISPIVWTFILSLLNEILLGPQGILILIERQGGL